MISVCMATYNGEKYIRNQIESVLSQLGEEDEVIISDDGSIDDTLKILWSYNDNRIKIYNNQRMHGFVGNFENALSHARGDYIFLSDQDDIWKKEKVPKVIECLKQYDLIVHDAELIDGEGKQLGKTYYSLLHHHTSFIMNFYKSRWLGCCMAFQRRVLDSCIPFPPKIVGHDYWIGMYGMMKFKYHFMDDVLISYRRHGGNLSPSGEESNNSLFYKIYTKRLYLLKSLIARNLL